MEYTLRGGAVGISNCRLGLLPLELLLLLDLLLARLLLPRDLDRLFDRLLDLERFRLGICRIQIFYYINDF